MKRQMTNPIVVELISRMEPEFGPKTMDRLEAMFVAQYKAGFERVIKDIVEHLGIPEMQDDVSFMFFSELAFAEVPPKKKPSPKKVFTPEEKAERRRLEIEEYNRREEGMPLRGRAERAFNSVNAESCYELYESEEQKEAWIVGWMDGINPADADYEGLHD